MRVVRHGVKRIHLAQDKVLWRAPANTVMNSRVHWTQTKTSSAYRAEPSRIAFLLTLVAGQESGSKKRCVYQIYLRQWEMSNAVFVQRVKSNVNITPASLHSNVASVSDSKKYFASQKYLLEK